MELGKYVWKDTSNVTVSEETIRSPQFHKAIYKTIRYLLRYSKSTHSAVYPREVDCIFDDPIQSPYPLSYLVTYLRQHHAYVNEELDFINYARSKGRNHISWWTIPRMCSPVNKYILPLLVTESRCFPIVQLKSSKGRDWWHNIRSTESKNGDGRIVVYDMCYPVFRHSIQNFLVANSFWRQIETIITPMELYEYVAYLDSQQDIRSVPIPMVVE